MSAGPEFPYRARARLADNLFLLRKRAGYSQFTLGERAFVFPSVIGSIENGKSLPQLDVYVRLAGSLGVTLGDLAAGVTWTPAIVDLGFEAGYRVELETETTD